MKHRIIFVQIHKGDTILKKEMCNLNITNLCKKCTNLPK